MKKLIVFVAVSLAATSAWADWVQFSSSNGNMFFMETSAISRVNGNVRAWIMEEHPQVNKLGERSNKQYMEIDCREKKLRMLSFQSFNGSMGGGSSLGSDNNPDSWSFASPGSVDMSLVRTACSRS